MRFEIPQSALVAAAETCAAVADQKAAQHGCRSVLISAGAKEVVISSNAIERAVRVKLPSVDVEKPGDVAVDAKAFLERVKSIKTGNISLEVKKDHLQLRASGRNYRMPTTPVADVPGWPLVTDGPRVEVTAKPLVASIARAMKFASESIDKPRLFGVILSFEDANVIVAAADGHKLMSDPLQGLVSPSIAPKRLLLPPAGAAIASRILASVDQTATMTLGSTSIVFEADGVELSVALSNAEPERVEMLLRNRAIASSCTVVRAEMLAIVRAAELSADRVNEKDGHVPRIGVRVVDGKMIAVAKSDRGGEAEAACDVIDGELGDEVGFDARYVVDALNAFTSDSVRIDRAEEEMRGFSVSALDGDDKGICIVMQLEKNWRR